MRVVVASHPSAIEHYTGMYHPERPQRVGAIIRGLEDSGLPLYPIQSPEASRDELTLVHDHAYIDHVHRLCERGGGALDMDTVVSGGSWKAALTAAGGTIAAVREVAAGDDSLGFAVTRPPGHHALRDRAMGFCLFNNIVIATRLLQADGNRVAILDWDVHHGNGTQALVRDDPNVLYVSIHQGGFYPFEGHPSDIDEGAAPGTVVNVPLPAGTAGDVYRRAWQEIALPVLSQFEADWVLISAGYDAHVTDRLADLRLVGPDYGWMAARLSEVFPPSRVVLALEGGYELDALRESAAATVIGLATGESVGAPLSSVDEAVPAYEEAKAAIATHWDLIE